MEREKEKEKEIVKENPVRVGISIGDVNGIGPEVIIKALSDNRVLLDFTPVIYASNKVLAYHKKLVGNTEFSYQSCRTAGDAKHRKVNVVNISDEDIPFELGVPTAQSGAFAFQSLEAATQDLASGKIDVLVTAPISKDAMKQSGFEFPGHTEYLASLSSKSEALMLMVSGELRVALVTTHVPIKEVPSLLTTERILAKIKELDQSLRKDFGIIKPKIAVFGLNPHAGENGKMGTEEQEVIIPAIRKAFDEGIMAFGPYPADGFIGSNARKQFDGILAMYHDQGLSGFKALAFDDGVNFTAGLPIVRTSPDHGTAYDIVGKNLASPTSMLNAIYVAIDVYAKNQFIKEMNANPLPFSQKDNGEE